MKEQAWNYRSSVAKALNGTGEGGASKIHYYRIDNEALIAELESLGYEEGMIVTIMREYFACSNAYIYDGTSEDVRKIFYNAITAIIDTMWDAHRVKGLLVTEDIYFGNYPYITKGDLYTKIDYYIKTFSEEEVAIIKPFFDICLKHTTEITEDEFFGMCDLPITPLY